MLLFNSFSSCLPFLSSFSFQCSSSVCHLDANSPCFSVILTSVSLLGVCSPSSIAYSPLLFIFLPYLSKCSLSVFLVVSAQGFKFYLETYLCEVSYLDRIILSEFVTFVIQFLSMLLLRPKKLITCVSSPLSKTPNRNILSSTSTYFPIMSFKADIMNIYIE